MSTVTLSPNGIDAYRADSAPDRLFVSTMDGVVELAGGAAGDWKVVGRSLVGSHVNCAMFEPKSGLLFAGAHDGGLHRSKDGGKTWERSGLGQIESENIFSVAYVYRADGGTTFYAGTEPAFLYESRDGGETWTELDGLRTFPTRDKWSFPAPPHIAHLKHVTADPRDENILYVCVEQGALLKSYDGGKTFEELHFQDDSYKQNKDTHRIVFTPSNPDEIYLDGGDGIARSKDAGKTWERLATPEMRVGYPDQFYVSPDDENVLFVVGGGAPPNIWRQTGKALAAVARSDDRGRTWTQVAGGLPPEMAGNIEAATIFEWTGGFGFFLGTTEGEVFASFDKGLTWRLITGGIAPVSKCVHHRNLQLGRAAVAAAAQA